MFSRFAPTYQRCLQPKGLFIGTATLMCLMILATPVKAQKPKPPQLPPVRYQVQLWTVPGAKFIEMLDTNNQLQSVGSIGLDLDGDGVNDRIHGFFYDPAVDLDGFGIDLNDIVAIPEGWQGWHIRKATAINEVGQIAVYLSNTETTSPSSELQAAVIDMNQVTPVLHVIPDRALTDSSVFADINDSGDVVATYRKENGNYGHYFYNVYISNSPTEISGVELAPDNFYPPNINNDGVIVGHRNRNDGYRRSALGVFEEFPGLRPNAMNENGAFCGGTTVTTTKPRGTANYAFVYETSLTVNKIANEASDLNSTLDSVVGPYWLNHRDLGNFRIEDLLDPTDPNTSLLRDNFFTCRNMTERDPTTNFPALSTSVTSGGTSWGVHLIPVTYP